MKSLVLVLLVSACTIGPPDHDVILKTEVLPNANLLHTFNKWITPITGKESGPPVWRPSGRYVIFVARDEYVQNFANEEIKKAFPNSEELRIEELFWWIAAPKLKRIYDYAIRIPYDNFWKETLFSALEKMESWGQPYDLFLLTHASFANHLSTAKPHPLLARKTFLELKGKLSHLNLVFLQSCFGLSFSDVLLGAGAKKVIGYSGLQSNYLFVDEFMRYYSRHGATVDTALLSAKVHMFEDVKNDPIYAKVYAWLWPLENNERIRKGKVPLSFEDFLRNLPFPTLSSNEELTK